MGGAEIPQQNPQIDIQKNTLKINGEKLLDKNDFIIDENDAQKLEKFLQSQIENEEEITDEIRKNIDKNVRRGDLLKYTGSILEGTFNFLLDKSFSKADNGNEITLDNVLQKDNQDIESFLSMLKLLQQYDTNGKFATYKATINIDGVEHTVEIGLNSLIQHLETTIENKKNEVRERLERDRNKIAKILDYINTNKENTNFIERITERSENRKDGIKINTGNLNGKFLGSQEEFVQAINENNTKRNGEQIILQEEETEQVNTETEQVNTETEQVNTETEQVNTETEQVNTETALITFLEDITDDNIESKAIELFEQNSDIIANLEETDLQNEEFKNVVKSYLDLDTNIIEITKIVSSGVYKYPKGTTYLEITDSEENTYEIIPGSQDQINMMIVNHLTETKNTELLAQHLTAIDGDASNRGTTASEQLKNIQEILGTYLKDQSRSTNYINNISNKDARQDLLNERQITDPSQRSILESYTTLYDNLYEEAKPKTLQDQVKDVTEQVKEQANKFREQRGDVIVQATDFFFGGKDGLLATLDERGIKIPRLTDKIKEQYQKEFAFSSEQQETFTKIVEGLPQEGDNNPFTQTFGTPKEAINKFFENNTQKEYLKVAKEQYKNFSPKAVQQLVSLYNKGNPNNTVEVKNFIELNDKNEPTGIIVDSREQFTTILKSKTTQNLITQADQQINGYKKVGENYVYNMNPENFGSATDKKINTAKDVAQYMTAFLVAGEKDFKYVITENSLIDTGEQKEEVIETQKEQFNKQLETIKENINQYQLSDTETYEYSKDNTADYQTKVLQPISELFAEDNYDLLVKELKENDDSTIKERLQNPENFKNLFLFENKLDNIKKNNNENWNTINAVESPSIKVNEDRVIIAETGASTGTFELRPTNDTNKKIITKIEKTSS